MRHPTEGVLRRLVDEPAGVGARDRGHVADCARCLDRLVEVREDAALVAAAVSTSDRADVDGAWHRLQAATDAPAARTAPVALHRPRRLRGLVRRPAVAGLAAAVVLAGAGTAAANGWLKIFQTERVAAVGLQTADLVALPDLTAYGDVELSGRPGPHPVADPAAAEAESGLEVPEVTDLPRGVSGEPTYQVGGQVTAVFTFSAAKAAEAAAEAGERAPAPPPGLDGSAVRLVAGPGVAQVWESDAGVPALLVGRATAPQAFSTGVPFETVRDHLLSLPGFPADVAAQLRTFTADGSTLPLPVPAEQVRTWTAEVDGAPATVLETRDRTLAAVVWVQDGVVTAVAGSLDRDEVLSVARGIA